MNNNDFLIVDPYSRYDGSVRAREKLYLTSGLSILKDSKMLDSLYVPNLANKILNGENLEKYIKINELKINKQ